MDKKKELQIINDLQEKLIQSIVPHNFKESIMILRAKKAFQLFHAMIIRLIY